MIRRELLRKSVSHLILTVHVDANGATDIVQRRYHIAGNLYNHVLQAIGSEEDAYQQIYLIAR